VYRKVGGREGGRMAQCGKGLLNNSKREESTYESSRLVPVSHTSTLKWRMLLYISFVAQI